MTSLSNALGLLSSSSPCCGHKLQIPAASRCLLGGPSATCAGSAETSGSWWPRWQKCCLEIRQPTQTLRQLAPWYLGKDITHHHFNLLSLLIVPFIFYKCIFHSLAKPFKKQTPVSSPMTQKGFLANFSLPLHPLYRQQQPADHILTIYSTPNTTMVTISCIANHGSEVYHLPRMHHMWSKNLHAEQQYAPGCTRHSQSYFWTLWWWQKRRGWDRKRPRGS